MLCPASSIDLESEFQLGSVLGAVIRGGEGHLAGGAGLLASASRDGECACAVVVEWPLDYQRAVLHGVGEGALPQLADRGADTRAVGIANEIDIPVVVKLV